MHKYQHTLVLPSNPYNQPLLTNKRLKVFHANNKRRTKTFLLFHAKVESRTRDEFRYSFFCSWDLFGPETFVNKKLNARSSLHGRVKKVVNRVVATEYQYPCYNVICEKSIRFRKLKTPFQKEKPHTSRLVCVDLCSIHYKSTRKEKQMRSLQVTLQKVEKISSMLLLIIVVFFHLLVKLVLLLLFNHTRKIVFLRVFFPFSMILVFVICKCLLPSPFAVQQCSFEVLCYCVLLLISLSRSLDYDSLSIINMHWAFKHQMIFELKSTSRSNL